MIYMNHIALSLFCGAGGCSAGFKKAGYDILLASDRDKTAIDTYKANFPNINCLDADICDIDFNGILSGLGLAIGELDFLIGGPPCQGFSTAGSKFWEDPRNELFKQYINALQIMRPKWFLMENVEGLLTADKGNYIYEVAQALVASGYQIRVEKIYAQEYGIPQRRKRVLIMGNRLGIDFQLPKPLGVTHGRIFRCSDVTLRDAIAGLPEPSQQPAELSYTSPAINSQEDYLRGTATVVSDHFSPPMTDLQLARIQALQPGQTMKDLPIALQHESFKRRANRRVMDGTPTEKRGGAPSGLKRLFFDEPCLTITGAATREFIHPDQDRPLTIREAARIQTFPDDFLFVGNASEKIQQIGNAIPPLLSYILANHIKDNYGFTEVDHRPGRLLGFRLTKASAMSPALKLTEQRLSSISGANYSKQLTLIG
jgi:DNA (cytosine-5)-methyltransferase 1